MGRSSKINRAGDLLLHESYAGFSYFSVKFAYIFAFLLCKMKIFGKLDLQSDCSVVMLSATIEIRSF